MLKLLLAQKRLGLLSHWFTIKIPMSPWMEKNPNWMESQKIHVPNHQPNIRLFCMPSIKVLHSLAERKTLGVIFHAHFGNQTVRQHPTPLVLPVSSIFSLLEVKISGELENQDPSWHEISRSWSWTSPVLVELWLIIAVLHHKGSMWSWQQKTLAHPKFGGAE